MLIWLVLVFVVDVVLGGWLCFGLWCVFGCVCGLLVVCFLCGVVKYCVWCY